MSMNPGQTTNPAGTATAAAPPTGRSAPTAATRPSSMRTSIVPLIPCAGSITPPALEDHRLSRHSLPSFGSAPASR